MKFQHCCVCAGVCHHVGGISLCDEHKARWPYSGQVTIYPPQPTPVVPPVARACPSKFEAVLGFPALTIIPCGLAEGHDGPHVYHAEWGTS